jgi:hypothetical protein
MIIINYYYYYYYLLDLLETQTQQNECHTAILSSI